MGQLCRALPLPSDVLGLFGAGHGETRISPRRLADDIAAFPLHAVGAVWNGGSRSESEDGGLRIEDGAEVLRYSQSSILYSRTCRAVAQKF